MRFFEELCQRQGLFMFDEPESALSPSRQVEFLKLLRAMDESRKCQVIMATHSPMLLAYPNATLLGLTRGGLAPARLEETEHYRLMRDFTLDPKGFIDAAVFDLARPSFAPSRSGNVGPRGPRSRLPRDRGPP